MLGYIEDSWWFLMISDDFCDSLGIFGVPIRILFASFRTADYPTGDFSARHGVEAPGTCLDVFGPGDSTALGSLVTWEKDTRSRSKCPGKFEGDQGAAKDTWVCVNCAQQFLISFGWLVCSVFLSWALLDYDPNRTNALSWRGSLVAPFTQHIKRVYWLKDSFVHTSG